MSENNKMASNHNRRFVIDGNQLHYRDRCGKSHSIYLRF